MWKLWSLLHLLHLSSAMLASAKTRSNGTTLWKTLSGNAPLVIARGGFSGLFPDSSGGAYEFAGHTSLPNVIYWCDVQLTKDGAGICFPDLTLDNASDIKQIIYKNKGNTYYVNGVKTSGWFSVDFTINDLANVTLTQENPARGNYYDGIYKILTVQVVAKLYPPELWLNVQHDAFFSQQNLSMRSYILSVFRSTKVDYISSPEVSFLKSILARKPNKTKLIFRFPGQAELVEPSTNQTYSSLLRNLTFIKTFASGILVPKTYIWPVDRDLYLEPHTSIVFDAHKEGLEVFASDFANDIDFAYDFAYDPIAEYLHFIDNGNFSVDGVVSDFPITPSEAIGCFSHIGKRMKAQANPLVISSEGSSGYYPGCTDLAYQRAISGGVDVLDCPVQMSKDGIPVCLGSINLSEKTNAAESNFNNLILHIPELGGVTGIFTFSLTWSEIQSLKPKMSNPYGKDYNLFRNPNFSEDVKLMTLSEFLVLANNANSVSGVLISIEDAAYLAEKQGLSVIDAVLDALKNASHNNDTVKKVMIQSTDSAVLIKLREKSNYELVYKVPDAIRDADNSTITEIKKFANSVVVRKGSVFSFRVGGYITSINDVVSKLQAFNLSVYVGLFRNEFVSQAWDFLGDANVEINTFVKLVQIDGIITEFPGTASRHKRNRCLGLGNKTPTYMNPVRPGVLSLRLEKAKLLGYNNHAEVSMATKMATVDKAQELLEKLRSASWSAAVKDMEDLKQFCQTQGAPEANDLSHWDITFWSERLRESKYEINEEELRPYFSLPKVLDGLFNLAKMLFGIQIEPADGSAPVWNKDVKFYRVNDSSVNPIAYFYFDPYSRPSEKRGGAWMDEVVARSRVFSRDGASPRLPVAHMVCNQMPPVGDKPSLMTFREVETVFHEFGHALQHMLTKQDEGLVAGIRGIEWDAVELPSQFMENWCYHRDTLMGIAKHYETGESLPEDIYQKLLAARTYRAGSLSLRQLRFACLDLELHTKYIPGGSESIYDVDQRVSKRTQVIPPLPEDRFLCSFSHIFAGGYAAGYYSYKWAEVLSADAFSAFEDAGLNDEKAVKQTGQRFRETILALGGGKAPLEVFVEFRGREPSPEALLRHNGLLSVSASA